MASSNLIKQLQERGLVARSIAASILPLTACIWGIWFHCYA